MAPALRLIDPQQRAASIGMLAAFVSYSVLFPLYIYFERPGWIWDYPGRNFAMEHMLIVNYAVLGAFFLYGARAPLRFVALIDLTIVFNILHATMMLIDALGYPNHQNHLRPGGDVPATYLIPIVLILTHPKRFYLMPPTVAQPGNA
jgi:hypothetical protein